VLLADGQALFRKGVRALLGGYSDLQVVGEARTADDVTVAVARTHPHVVVTDLDLPDGGAGGALGQLRARCPGVRAIVLTATTEQGAVMEALSDGAKGYVLKDSSPDVLVTAIRAVHAGETWVQREMVRELAGELRRVHSLLGQDGRILTQREEGVLRLLAIGMSTAEIAAQLFLSQSTVRVHLMRILQKLGLKNRIQAVRFAIKHGLAET
jgi:DNA-binding NarL/FixJ family response regulator